MENRLKNVLRPRPNLGLAKTAAGVGRAAPIIAFSRDGVRQVFPMHLAPRLTYAHIFQDDTTF